MKFLRGDLKILFSLFFFISCGKEAKIKEVKILSLNAYNYIESKSGFVKSLKKREALARFIARSEADIVFLSEMGGEGAVKDLLEKLNKYKASYPFWSLVKSFDSVRNLLIISRFKAKKITHQIDLPYVLKNEKRKVLRGIAHCTFIFGKKSNPYVLEILGVHLKSPLFHRLGAENIRYEEAKILSQFINKIQEQNNQANILLLGDFNDHKNSRTIEAIKKNKKEGLYPLLYIADTRGEVWTYYYFKKDLYSRIDFAFASYSLLPEIIKGQSFLVEDYQSFSDHRPLVVKILPIDKKSSNDFIPRYYRKTFY